MSGLLRAIDRLSAFAAALAAACLVLMTLSIVAEIASITLLNRSLVFTWEAAAFLMAAAFFLGLPWTLNSGGHVRVQLLYSVVPERAEPILDLAATVFGFAIALFLASALGSLAWGSFIDGSRTFTATSTPLALPQGVAAAGAALLALQLAARAVRLVTGRTADTAERQSETV